MLSCLVSSVQELLTFKDVFILPASASLYPCSPRGNLVLGQICLLTCCDPVPKPAGDNPCPRSLFGLGGYRVVGSVSEGDATEQFHVSHRVPSVRKPATLASSYPAGKKNLEENKRKPTKTRRPLILL